ncbi:MAG: 2-oxoacid:acceptor oxidoreductase family protein, partial [Candidatus Omnitrophica bacterium]|nr:2-oxoacid:acceptor oxidoreductase family protein [Candidatus Omnitrophota bacterium]
RSDVKAQGIPITTIIKAEKAAEIMCNTCMIGAFAKAGALGWGTVEKVLRKEITREIDLNLKVARLGYDQATKITDIAASSQEILPLLSGNQAIGLGLIKGGLDAFIAYPMTPSSPILHFLAEIADDFGLQVIHPESEIGVILLALGFSYMGKKVAVGTSGGGFCLMTEGLSLAGMAELPIVIIVGQRPGPSTGLPTYSAQTELHFVLSAGQGEFPRFIVAPGDAQEAYIWSTVALNMSWKYQIPSIILSDKNMGEGIYNFDRNALGEAKEAIPLLWDKKSSYKRYQVTETGISPLAFAPQVNEIIKVNSYEHDEFGVTTEDPRLTTLMQDKRLRKEQCLAAELKEMAVVNVCGNNASSVALLCWGSNKGVCEEVAQRLAIKVIQPLVLWPFPIEQFQKARAGVKKLICVESNATGQLTRLLQMLGFKVDAQVLQYDGRPFSLDDLEEKIKGLMA